MLEHTSQNVFSFNFRRQEFIRSWVWLILYVHRFYLQILFDIAQARVESGETGVTGTCRTRLHPWVLVVRARVAPAAGLPPPSSPRRASARAHPPRPAPTDNLTTTTKQVRSKNVLWLQCCCRSPQPYLGLILTEDDATFRFKKLMVYWYGEIATAMVSPRHLLRNECSITRHYRFPRDINQNLKTLLDLIGHVPFTWTIQYPSLPPPLG